MRVLFILLITFFISFGGFAQTEENDINEVYKYLDLFTSALSIVQRDHVDAPQIKKLIYGALRGMLSSLDPHSQFLTPKDYQEMQVETEGKFSGIGVEITIRDSYLMVVSALEGTPAFSAGIRPKDRIRKIDGKSTRNLSLEKAVKKLRGKKGSIVTLHIDREDHEKFLVYKIKRDVIHIESIKRIDIVDENIAYIRLTEFQERSARDISVHLEDLKTQSIKGIILDLRNNPGGLLQASVEVTDKFVDAGQMVVYIKGRRANQNLNFYSKEPSTSDLPLVVLVNEGSASAAEIVAGAVIDLNRGKVVGQNSFGKGSVQSVIPLKDGSAIKLTTAKYFTPNGKSIQENGITPDIAVALSEEEKQEWHQHRKDKKDSPLWLDPQIQVAIAVLQNKPYAHILERNNKPQTD